MHIKRLALRPRDTEFRWQAKSAKIGEKAKSAKIGESVGESVQNMHVGRTEQKGKSLGEPGDQVCGHAVTEQLEEQLIECMGNCTACKQ